MSKEPKIVNFTKTGKPTTHGTLNTYKRHGCRCDMCRKAKSDCQRDWYRELSPRQKEEYIRGVMERAEARKQRYYSELVQDMMNELGLEAGERVEGVKDRFRAFVKDWNGQRNHRERQSKETE